MAKKYIDAEKLIVEIGSLYDNMLNRAKLDSENTNYWNGKADAYRAIYDHIDSLQQEQLEFPTTDEEVEKALASLPKEKLPDKYKTPDWLFKQQEQPDTCIFGNTPSEEACKFCGVRSSGRTSNGLLKIKVTNPACRFYKEEKI